MHAGRRRGSPTSGTGLDARYISEFLSINLPEANPGPQVRGHVGEFDTCVASGQGAGGQAASIARPWVVGGGAHESCMTDQRRSARAGDMPIPQENRT